MSELINNSKDRQEKLKALIRSIHQKEMNIDDAKKRFKEDFGSISTDEIVALEQALVEEGVSIEEIQSLCDVHAAVFNQSISDIHKPKSILNIPGHPAKVFADENKQILALIEEDIMPNLDLNDASNYLKIRIAIDRLVNISKHYARKEYLFFPAMEKRGITSIPKVMWGVDDEIRRDIKRVQAMLNHVSSHPKELRVAIEKMIERIKDMVIKEDNILMPKLVDVMKMYDWIMADQGSDEIGYFIEKPKESWKVKTKTKAKDANQKLRDEVNFDVGSLKAEELIAMMNTLPFDMTFVDKDGYVKYFTQGKERIFERPSTVIGRHVSLCHPPQSVHIVEDIINRFKSGQQDHEHFYIHLKDMYVYIQYYAVRNDQNDYLGTLEITQDIKPIQAIEGEKRLVSNI